MDMISLSGMVKRTKHSTKYVIKQLNLDDVRRRVSVFCDISRHETATHTECLCNKSFRKKRRASRDDSMKISI
jgi:hypothetical protein